MAWTRVESFAVVLGLVQFPVAQVDTAKRHSAAVPQGWCSREEADVLSLWEEADECLRQGEAVHSRR